MHTHSGLSVVSVFVLTYTAILSKKKLLVFCHAHTFMLVWHVCANIIIIIIIIYNT